MKLPRLARTPNIYFTQKQSERRDLREKCVTALKFLYTRMMWFHRGLGGKNLRLSHVENIFLFSIFKNYLGMKKIIRITKKLNFFLVVSPFSRPFPLSSPILFRKFSHITNMLKHLINYCVDFIIFFFIRFNRCVRSLLKLFLHLLKTLIFLKQRINIQVSYF